MKYKKIVNDISYSSNSQDFWFYKYLCYKCWKLSRCWL